MGSLMGLFQIIPRMSCMITIPCFKRSTENGTMKYFTIQLVILLCFFSGYAKAQNKDSVHKAKHRFSVYLGAGPNYYFNNLPLGKNHVNVVNYSFVCRFMWEPEHFLSLGVETG